MTFLALVENAHAKTHAPEQEIISLVQRSWPTHIHFTPTQSRLLVSYIERNWCVLVRVEADETGAEVST